VTWTATWKIEPKQLQAVPKAAARVERGAAVVFDGTASRGDITRYSWTLEPTGCPDRGKTVVLEGARQEVTLLCSVTAKLTVSDGTSSDEETVAVEVAPRPNWKVDFKHRPDAGAARMPFFLGELHYGVNTCALDGVEHPAESVADRLHWDHASERPRYSGGAGYVAKQIQDQGPFGGRWHVGENRLRVHRQSFINSRLFPGPNGDIYELNARAGNKQMMHLLTDQIMAHETIHSDLMQEVLQSREAREVVAEFEALHGASEGQLEELAVEKLSALQTLLAEGSADTKVKERLRRIPRFNRGGTFLAEDGEYTFSSLAELGDDWP
jgi:hypothetical protein